MAALTALVAVIIDVQFNQIVDQAYADKDAKAAFFGEFFAYLSILALAFQVLAAPRVLRSLGVVPALFFLPASMALGSLAVLVVPGLLGGVLVKLGDGSFRHSIHKAATELLYLPIPRQAKKRTKVFLDATVDNLATGLGAVLVLLAVGAGVFYSHLAFLSLALIGLWLLLIGRSRHAYIDAFRQAIERRQIDLADYTVDINEAATLGSLMTAMSRGNERHSIYALDMLAHVTSPDVVEPVAALLSHASAEVRYKALRVLRNQTGELPLAQIEALQSDEDLQVRIEALYCLCLHGEGDRVDRLKGALSSSDGGIRTAAVGCIAEHGTDAEQDLIDESFIRQLWTQTADDLGGRVQVATIVGTLYEPARRPYLREILRRLMEETEPSVVRRTIQSLGELRDPDHIQWLLRCLDSRIYRRDAREAVASYGTQALPSLSARLRDTEAGFLSRSRAVRVMADIPQQECVDVLLDSLDGVEPLLQYAIIKSLSKLRNAAADLRFDSSRVAGSLQQSAQSYYGLLQVLRLYGQAEDRVDDRGTRLLLTAVRERQQLNLKRMFRVLGLRYSPNDMFSAYQGYVSGNLATRASALEFLDNVLHREEKELLVPFLDSTSPAAGIAHGKRLFGGAIDSWPDAVGFLMQSGDAWLRACAVYSLKGARERGEFRDQVSRLRRDPDPVVRESADLVLPYV